ncbi:pyridoxamine 5'-phosphate oxidase family protein [Streptomyces sp. NBC_01283]|uniref:helix-turn-helix domain-containing protein n=1 Tax=Streptomyces sp. NBC_01283 TaxID=2903812 RepID=UPI00352D3143|nr:pyridoxamine 5'-phosphate oxidase family protein [Streptomyces sp. NBC_01283]
MSPTSTPGPAAPASRTRQGDMGRRVSWRREQLGLSRQDVAERCGSAPGYIRYVEEQSITSPGIGFLTSLADALETTVAELSGGTADLPPGTGRAPYRPQFTELGVGECRRLLGTHGIGRVGLSTPDGPVILPVNYILLEDAVAYRTAPNALPASAAGNRVAFEVDRVDDALSQGWSVLLIGTARAVADPVQVCLLNERARSLPWTGGDRDLWIAITPTRITGRRIAARHTYLSSAVARPELQ